jgi:hypothetical protein
VLLSWQWVDLSLDADGDLASFAARVRSGAALGHGVTP